MRWRNSQSGFGMVAIAFHWVTAVVVIGLFALGLWMVELSYYDEWYQRAPAIHKSVGIVLLVLLVLRYLWRLSNPQPRPLGPRIERRLARFVHGSMYLLLFATSIAGYLIPTAQGRPIDVFGVVAVPATLTDLPQQEDLAGQWHLWTAWALIFLAAGHTLAALKHHLVDGDATLRRMVSTSQTGSFHTRS